MSGPATACFMGMAHDEIAKTRSVTARSREVNRKGPRLSLNPQQLR